MDDDKPENVVKGSSSVVGYSYDAQTYELIVWFHGGVAYQYSNVMPPEMSQVFDSPGSVGAKLRRLIVKTHKAKKLG